MSSVLESEERRVVRQCAVISIVIPARNESAYLPAVIGELRDLRSPHEIVVVDVASTDDTAAVAERANVRLVRSAIALNAAAARNLGVRNSTAPVIAFVDADVLVTRSWRHSIEELVQRPESFENAVMGAPYGIGRAPTWIEKRWFAASALHEPRYINGGNLLVHRTTFENLGGFDEGLVTGEDFDFCERARSLGHEVIIERRLDTVHLGNPATVKAFVLREAWHALGDFSSVRRALSSKIALLSVAFLLSLIALAVGLGLQLFSVVVVAALTLFTLCALLAHRRWRGGRLTDFVLALPVAAMYLAGRSAALVLPASVISRMRLRQKATDAAK